MSLTLEQAHIAVNTLDGMQRKEALVRLLIEQSDHRYFPVLEKITNCPAGIIHDCPQIMYGIALDDGAEFTFETDCGKGIHIDTIGVDYKGQMVAGSTKTLEFYDLMLPVFNGKRRQFELKLPCPSSSTKPFSKYRVNFNTVQEAGYKHEVVTVKSLATKWSNKW